MRSNQLMTIILLGLLSSFVSYTWPKEVKVKLSIVNELANFAENDVLNFDKILQIQKYRYSDSNKIAGKILGPSPGIIHIEKYNNEWTGILILKADKVQYKAVTEGDKVVFTQVELEDIYQE